MSCTSVGALRLLDSCLANLDGSSTAWSTACLRLGSSGTGSMTHQSSQGGLIQRRVALQGHVAGSDAAGAGARGQVLQEVRRRDFWDAESLPPAATIKPLVRIFPPSSSSFSRDLFEFCRFPVGSSRVSAKTKLRSRHSEHYFASPFLFWTSLRMRLKGSMVSLSLSLSLQLAAGTLAAFFEKRTSHWKGVKHRPLSPATACSRCSFTTRPPVEKKRQTGRQATFPGYRAIKRKNTEVGNNNMGHLRRHTAWGCGERIQIPYNFLKQRFY